MISKNDYQIFLKDMSCGKSNYSNAYYDIKASIKPTPDNNGLIWSLQSQGSRQKFAGKISTDDISESNTTQKS